MTFVYKPRYGGDPDMTRCRADVGKGFFGSQCTRKPKVERDGIGFCAQHDPVARKEKQAAWERNLRAKWAEKDKASERAKAVLAFRCEAVEALRKIADGYNDARGLAQEIIAKEPS